MYWNFIIYLILLLLLLLLLAVQQIQHLKNMQNELLSEVERLVQENETLKK